MIQKNFKGIKYKELIKNNFKKRKQIKTVYKFFLKIITIITKSQKFLM